MPAPADHREHVTPVEMSAGAPFPLGRGGAAHANEPRRRTRQGKPVILRGAPAPGLPVKLARLWNNTNVHTTLGNGYLGSRIDEERSEMRYLV